MNILVLCLSPGYGGLELYALREIEVLQKRGIPCQGMVAAGSLLARQLNAKGIPARRLSRLNPIMPILAARRLARFIDEQEIDVLHIHWAKDLPLAALAKKLARRPLRLVVSRHMALSRSKRDSWHHWQYRQIDCFITVTKLLAQQAVRYLPLAESKIRVLYLGAKASEEKEPDCDQFFEAAAFPRRSLNLALYGRIEPYKGQHILIEALQKLVADGLDVSATIIGHVMDQSYARQLQDALKEADLNKHVRFVDFIPDAATHMGCFDVIVLTTESETFGLVLIEAMQAGVAVIGTNAGGVPEIIDDGETGLLTQPGDSLSLANAIEQLYRNVELRKKLARQGQQKARAQFMESIHFEKLVEILNEK